MRQLIGARIELGVGEMLLLEHQRRGLRRAPHLCLEQLVNALVPQMIGCRDVALPQQQLALGCREQRQPRDRLRRIRHDPFQQNPPVRRHALDRRSIEQVRRIFDDDIYFSLFFRHGEMEVELRRLVANALDDLHLQSRELQLSRRRVLQCEANLEQRIARQIPRRRQLLDQLREWHILMRIGCQRLRTHACQIVLEARLPRQVPAQHQHVHEEADQPFELRPTAPGKRHPHRHILLPAVAIQEHLERRQERHEQRGSLASAEFLQRAREILSKLEPKVPAAIARHRRPRPIRRQLQHRQVCECVLPIGKLFLQHLSP